MGSPTSTKRTKELCTVKEFKELNAIGVGEFLEAGGITRNVVDRLRQHDIDGDCLYGTKYDLLEEIGLKFTDYVKIVKLTRLLREPDTLDTKGGSRTVKDFKELNTIGVGEFLEAGGIPRNVVNRLKKYDIDGNSLYGMKYDFLEEIGLKFTDYVKIVKLTRLLREPVTLDTKGGSRTGDSKSAKSKDFQANVALVIWNNYDGKEGVELKNLREDVKNIKQTLRSLHFDIVKWGKDVKLKNFLEKLEEFYDNCIRSTDIGAVFVFYYGHGGRYKDRDGMIFDCGTHVPLSIVERKLNTLKRLRNVPTAIFFNACREDLKKWDKIFEDEKAKYSVTGSKEHSGSHVDMTKVLVVYACLKEKKAIYWLKKGSISEEKFMSRVIQRPGLEFEAGSPFGIVVAQRLWDDGSPYALHMAIQAIIDDMKEIGLRVDVPNFKHLNDLLPPFVRVPKARRKEKIVEVKITLLSQMIWADAFKKDFTALQERIRSGVTVSTHKQRHGKCTLTEKLEVIPIPYDPEDEKNISNTNSFRNRVRWNIVAYYKLEVEEDKDRLIKAIDRKMTKYVNEKNDVYKWKWNPYPGSLIANILIVLKHGHHKIEDDKFFNELLTFEIDGRKLEPNVTTSRQEWEHWNVAMMLNARVSSRIELMALMDAANITIGGYRFQACTAVVAEWRPNKVDKPKINPDQKAVEDKRKRDEGDNLVQKAVEDERRRDKVDKAELKKGPQKSIFEAVREGSFEVVKVLIPKYRSRLNINQLVDDKRRSLLHLACEYRRVDIARYLLDSKAEIDARDKWDKTPLLVACGKGNLPLVSCLVEAKANINATDSNSDGPLHKATELEDLELVKYLVENAKSDIKAVNKYGRTSLHIACRIKNLKIVQLLLNAEPSVASSADIFGWTPLMIACEAVDLPTVQCLMEAQADVKAINCYGKTSLHIACRKKNLKIVQLLLNVEPNVASFPDKSGWTPLMIACEAVDLPTVQCLMEAQADVKAINCYGDGLLHLAAESRDMSMTRYLVKKTQANINAVNSIDQTPLSIAYRNGDSLMMKLLIDSKANLETSKIPLGDGPLHVAVRHGNLKAMQYLVEKAKADVKSVNEQGDGPLHIAVQLPHYNVVQYLVKAKADIKAVNKEGNEPLHMAVKGGKLQTIKYLVESAKADIKAVNGRGDGPLHIAVQSLHDNASEIVQYLMEVKADIKAVNKQGDGPLHIAVRHDNLEVMQYLVEKAKANVKSVNKQGNEPLHMAVEGGKVQTIKYLVESAKADIKAVNAQGDEPLHIAVRNGNLKAMQYLVEKAKANVESVNKQGDGPLHIAVQSRNLEAMQYLVENAKANVKSINKQGNEPLHMAAGRGQVQTIRYLVEVAKTDMKAVNTQGDEPLHIAVRRANLEAIQYLVEKAKANVKSVNKQGNEPLHMAAEGGEVQTIKYLVESAKADMKAVNAQGEGPLHIAVRHGNLEAMKYLVEKAKANVESVNKLGDEPLHIAVRRGNLEAIQYLVEKAKANVKSVNKRGDGPLHIAAQSRLYAASEMVQYLVEAKADIKALNKEGDGPLHIAARHGNLKVMQYLVEEAKANVKSVNKHGQSPLAIAQAEMSFRDMMVQSPLGIAQAEMSFSDMMGQFPLAIAQAEMSFRDIMASYWKWNDVVRYLEKASSALNAEGETDEKDEEHHQENIERLKNELAKKAKDQDKNLIKKLEQAVQKHSPHMSQLKHEDKEVQL